jgi:hypothetical protein
MCSVRPPSVGRKGHVTRVRAWQKITHFYVLIASSSKTDIIYDHLPNKRMRNGAAEFVTSSGLSTLHYFQGRLYEFHKDNSIICTLLSCVNINNSS